MRSRLLPLTLATLVFAAGVVSCSLAYPIEGYLGGADPVDASSSESSESSESSTSASDADSPVPLPDASADASPANLFPAGTFEQDLGRSDCGPNWAITNLDVSRVPGGHDSAWACRICSQGSMLTAFDYYPIFTPTAVRGETYQSRVWVRSTSGTRDLESSLRFANGSSFPELASTGRQPIGTEWEELVVTRTIESASIERVNPVLFTFPSGPGECFIVDDIRVFKLQ